MPDVFLSMIGVAAIILPIVTWSLERSGQWVVPHNTIAMVTFVTFFLTPFATVTISLLLLFPPAILLPLAVPICSICFQDRLDSQREIRILLTIVNILIILVILWVVISTFMNGHFFPQMKFH